MELRVVAELRGGAGGRGGAVWWSCGSRRRGVVELRGVTGVAGEQWSCMSGVVEGDDGLRVRSEFLRGFFCKTVTRTTFPGRREYNTIIIILVLSECWMR